jgi:hypothetical protein
MIRMFLTDGKTNRNTIFKNKNSLLLMISTI